MEELQEIAFDVEDEDPECKNEDPLNDLEDEETTTEDAENTGAVTEAEDNTAPDASK